LKRKTRKEQKKEKKTRGGEKKREKLPNTHEEEPNPIISKNPVIYPIIRRYKPAPTNTEPVTGEPKNRKPELKEQKAENDESTI